MDTETFLGMASQILGLARDLTLYYAPIIGLLAGLKFLGDWIHKILFSKKV